VIIDAHTHVWPDRIADIALAGNALPGLVARGDGKISGLDRDMESSGVGVSCCLAIANEGRHVDRVNEFAASTVGTDRYAFGTVHVDLSAEDNLASLRRHGVTAVKIHPLFQGYALDDPRLYEIFEAMGSEFAVITHVGAGGDAQANTLSNPGMIRHIAQTFPDLRLVACHFGGYKLLDDAEELLSGVDVVLETSWPPSLATLRPERVRDLIKRHGADRVVFGSDWPMTSPTEEIAAIESLGLGDDDTKAVLGGTMARVLGLPSSWSR
jgi:predicted TIM-barrel fold metal-dependent hydrolase